MGEFGHSQQDSEWKAPEPKPSRRGFLKIAAGALLAAQIGERRPGPTTAPETKPRLTLEYLYKKYECTEVERHLIAELGREIPPEAIAEILNVDGVKDEQERREFLSRWVGLRVESMEELGIDSKNLRQYTLDRFPKGVFYGVQQIRYEDRADPMPEMYGPNFKGYEAAAHFNADRQEIVFFRARKADVHPYEVLKSLKHEISHSIAPEANRLLTREERLRLKLDIIKNFKASNPAESPYAWRIENKDPKTQLHAKTVEYFADKGEQYFTDSAMDWRPEELQTFEKLTKTIDPDFNRQRSKAAELKFLYILYKTYFKKHPG